MQYMKPLIKNPANWNSNFDELTAKYFPKKTSELSNLRLLNRDSGFLKIFQLPVTILKNFHNSI